MSPALWYDVPAGTSASQCKSCKAVIYWCETKTGKRMPVDCDTPGGNEPSAREGGYGVSHFTTCPDADKWGRR